MGSNPRFNVLRPNAITAALIARVPPDALQKHSLFALFDSLRGAPACRRSASAARAARRWRALE
eukprot:569690-Prymnesium_polylepis.1